MDSKASLLKTQATSSLGIHEWLFILFLIGIIGTVTVVSSLSKEPFVQSSIPKAGEKIEVLVKGAVQNPGSYKVHAGILLKDFLSFVKVLPNADLRRFKLNRPIQRSRILNIRSREMMTIYLNGAVKNTGPLTLPKGSRLMDLLKLIEFETGADVRFLNKKRLLKPEENLNVPFAASRFIYVTTPCYTGSSPFLMGCFLHLFDLKKHIK